jgi:hypothetical protein
MNKLVFTALVGLMHLGLFAQKVQITGLVKTGGGEPAVYAYVIDSATNLGTVTNNAGFFSLTVSHNQPLTLTASHVSYSPVSVSLVATRDTFVTFTLGNRNLDEVVVKGTPLARQAMTGAAYLEQKTIMNVPTFFGEHDVLRAITVLPGISGGIEDFAAIYVRGGNRDQNLFLSDGARLFSATHYGGMVSMFNPDLIRHIDVYKGGAPARYGEGLSSVIDMTLREGGENGSRLRLDVGNLRSGLLMEGNLGAKANYLVAGRIGYWSLFYNGFDYFKVLHNDDRMGEARNFAFYDVDAKFGFHPTPRTNMFLNIHLGEDYYNYFDRGEGGDYNSETHENIKYTGTQLATDRLVNNNVTLGLKTILGQGWALKNTLWGSMYTTFEDNVKARKYLSQTKFHNTYSFVEESWIREASEKLELIYGKIPGHKLILGGQVSLFETSSGRFHLTEAEVDSTWGAPNRRASEWGVFIEDDFQVFPGFFVNAGLRATGLSATDTVYFRLQPRVNVRYSIHDDLTVKGGFTVSDQVFHSLIEVNSFEETEFWLLANQDIVPQHAWQASGGVYGKLNGTRIEYSVEAYYKAMSGLLYFPAQIEKTKLMNYMQTDGTGKSAGAEFLIQKKEGKINWAIAYTLSRSTRQFDSINNGQSFVWDFDRRHDLNISLNYFRDEKNTFNVNYLLQSGRPFTMPVAYMPYNRFHSDYWIFEGLNNKRAPWTRRFDVSYTRKGQILHGRNFDFTCSVMNVFAHKNPTSMYVKENKVYMKSSYDVLLSGLLRIELFRNKKN